MKVIVVVAEAFHLGSVGCYGNEWVSTPALDRLAAEGVVFDNHIAERPGLGSFARAWSTGRYSFPPDPAAAAPPPGSFSWLRDGGVKTMLVSAPSPPASSVSAGDWDVVEPVKRRHSVDGLAAACRPVLSRVGASDNWLLRLDTDILSPPWDVPADFAGLYATDPEPPEEAGEEWAAPLESVVGAAHAGGNAAFVARWNDYAGAVSFFDAQLERLLNLLEKDRLLDDVLLIVTGAGGLAFGGSEGGAAGAYEDLVHVPLLVRQPGAAQAGLRVAAFSQHVDLLPTLADLYGVSGPAAHGHSLRPLLEGNDQPVRPYAVAGLVEGGGVDWLLRTRDWAVVLPVESSRREEPGRPRLYVKPDDRWEVNDLRQHHLEQAEHLARVLRAFVTATRGPDPLVWPELQVPEPVEPT